jgi:hypothetical protein
VLNTLVEHLLFAISFAGVLFKLLFHFVGQINRTLAALKPTPASAAKVLAAKRPVSWRDVAFKCVPLQEGEDMGTAEVEAPQELAPIADPLGLSAHDLRITQELYSSGRLAKTALLTRRATIAFLSGDGAGRSGRSALRSGKDFLPEGLDDDDDDDDDHASSALAERSKEKR